MRLNPDMQALRDYVTAPSSQNQADSTVRLLITHSNLKSRFMEIKLDLHVSWQSVHAYVLSVKRVWSPED